LDLTASREERRHDVTGEDGVVRTRAEKGRTRPLVTKFGQVTVSRIACRSPGRPNVHPLDAALSLPEEKHSRGLRKLAAVEAARGSIEAAGAAVTRATGVRTGKRQLEGLARRAAAHVEAYYAWRVIEPAPDGHPLVLTFDGKGIVMLPDALRPATAKAAAASENKLTTRLSPGEKSGRKRMAGLACVYDAVPVPRTPGDIISTPAQNGNARQVAAGIRRRATACRYSPAERAGAGECARYLDHKKDYLGYATARRKGWPIATGIIEGACRSIVMDRMDITGVKWGLEGAEAILKLRALIASGDFDDYWRYHLRREHERIHHARYQEAYILAA
ncbi:MAG TPA: ISKra4 family transposase, partial [Streptosporangiaceae bacterium]|nr:ISKra4 family transposase [Streptosporangiaceae bacterium]